MYKKEQPKPKERNIGVENALRDIKTKFGDGSIMKLGEAPKVDVDVVPSGSLSLDIALGVGGVPRGRIIEIYGPESSGKTTLMLHVIAEAQKKGGLAAFIDAEHALDPLYAKKIGVDIENLLISQPDSGEQALEITEAMAYITKAANPEASIKHGQVFDEAMGEELKITVIATGFPAKRSELAGDLARIKARGPRRRSDDDFAPEQPQPLSGCADNLDKPAYLRRQPGVRRLK